VPIITFWVLLYIKSGANDFGQTAQNTARSGRFAPEWSPEHCQWWTCDRRVTGTRSAEQVSNNQRGTVAASDSCYSYCHVIESADGDEDWWVKPVDATTTCRHIYYTCIPSIIIRRPAKLLNLYNNPAPQARFRHSRTLPRGNWQLDDWKNTFQSYFTRRRHALHPLPTTNTLFSS